MLAKTGRIGKRKERYMYSAPSVYIANFCAKPILAIKRRWHYNEFNISENSVVEKK
jgi:hypothetical protein